MSHDYALLLEIIESMERECRWLALGSKQVSPDNLVPILKCGVRTQLQTRPTCVFQRIYEK